MRIVDPNDIMMVARIASGVAIVYSALSLWRAIRLRVKSESDTQALDELWKRYERGEISWEEYEERATVLEAELEELKEATQSPQAQGSSRPRSLWSRIFGR